ncbi:MAG: hypothetical protein IT449_10770 [Phycisphaerales bacterium]|nr:hypothetical protein [Phycisphaerales bacterium]
MSASDTVQVTRRRPKVSKFVPGCVLCWIGGMVAIFNCPGLSGCVSREPDAGSDVVLKELERQHDMAQREYAALGGGVVDRLVDAWKNLPPETQQRLNELRGKLNQLEIPLWEARAKVELRAGEPRPWGGSIFWTLVGMGVAVLGLRGVYQSYQAPAVSP